MTETFQEFFDSRGVPVRVDRQSAVVRGVKILGLQSRNGRAYLPEALRQAVGLYEEAKVNVNHPKGDPGGPRDYQDRIGVMRNVAVRSGEGLFADFHFNPKHPLAEQLLWDAEHAPENVGFSHNVEARTTRRGERVVVEAITRVQSVDLVADPATTRGLFEAGAAGSSTPPENLEAEAPSRLAALTADDLRRHRPDLIEALCAGQNAELSRLSAEVERLTALHAVEQKRQTMGRLLREFRLPDPEAADPRSRSITSTRFVASLLAAQSDRAMRELVEERANLVRALGGAEAAPSAGDCKPLSADQYLVSGLAPSDAKAFVEAIT